MCGSFGFCGLFGLKALRPELFLFLTTVPLKNSPEFFKHNEAGKTHMTIIIVHPAGLQGETTLRVGKTVCTPERAGDITYPKNWSYTHMQN